VAAALPDLEAAVAEVEEECAGTRWRAGEPAIKIPADYYMARLKKADMRLFGYSSKAGGKTKGYSKSCQRQDDRQPNIMTLHEYARVKRCYADKVRFIDLPPRKPSDLPKITKRPSTYGDEFWLTDPDTGKPMWTIYGYESKTTPGEFRFLMCSELWCERDNLPLLRAEFAGTVGRGFSKPANTCPFCGGSTITVLESPEPGQSVIVRHPKEATGKLHQFIGTIMRSNKHPEGFPLPCCDTTPRLLKKYLDAQMKGRLVYGKDLGEDEEEVTAEETVAAAAVIEPDVPSGSQTYQFVLSSMETQYLLAPDKLLEPRRIGMLPPFLDKFFGQSSALATVTKGIRRTFAEGVQIFVGLGTPYSATQRGSNLFNALAPLMSLESAAEVRREFSAPKIDPTAPSGSSLWPLIRAFESANYGTLLLEWAANSRVTESAVESLIAGAAGAAGAVASRAHLVRLYRAWLAFLQYINNDAVPKQLRHLEHMLAAPGVVLPRGLLLIVLEPDAEVEGNVKVVCPSFGIPAASIYRDVPIGFLWHDTRDDRWTPLVLYKNTSQAQILFGDRGPELRGLTPPLARAIGGWIQQWRRSCIRPAPPPHVWTPDRDTTPLPRLSQLVATSEPPSRIVRDRSNRLAGVLYGQIFVPCLDDGALATTTQRVYDVDGWTPAPLQPTLTAYATFSERMPALKPEAILTRSDAPLTAIGLRLAIGTRIPIGATPLPEAAAPLPIESVDAFVWERDALILGSPDVTSVIGAESGSGTEAAGVEEQLAEAYQHLRLSFGRWINTTEGAPTKEAVLRIMNRRFPFPLYERRKRMDILLEPILTEWIAAESTDARRQLPVLRVDCIAIHDNEAACAAAGACRVSGGRCMIHAPIKPGAGVSPVRIFTARLTDELLRYAEGSRQILDGTVSAIKAPRGIVRIGDAMYVTYGVKESPQSVLQRLGFAGEVPDAFPEELLRFDGLEEEDVAVATAAAATTAAAVAAEEEALPTSWIERKFEVANPPTSVPADEARRLAFSAATGYSGEDILRGLRAWRTKREISAPDRPFQWSLQDFWVLSRIFSTNIVFARQLGDGRIKIDAWIIPESKADAEKRDKASQYFAVIWGPRQLTMFKTTRTGKTNWRFRISEFPSEFIMALDAAAPTDEEDVIAMTESLD